MSLAKVYTMAIQGMDGVLVEVEVDISPGLQSFQIVGMAGKSVQESKERVSSAIRHSGLYMPQQKIIVNLAPASLIKNDPFYDLPIAIGILAATNQVQIKSTQIFWGEVALDNTTRSCNGSLVVADSAMKLGYKEIYLPVINAKEAGMIAGIDVFGVKSLDALRLHLSSQQDIPKESIICGNDLQNNFEVDMQDVKGQVQAKRVMEIAAAGGHNVLMTGVPGAGKTFIAKAMRSILPSMEFAERVEVTKIHSIAGLLRESSLLNERPFRAPHHTSSQAALIGGGSNPRPGEVSLAHHGVLFLDEFNEFQNRVMEALRQPIEDKKVMIARAASVMTFPADFTLVAAMNPCKCGFQGDPDKNCTCSVADIQKYARKVSGPILDRIDLQVYINRIKNTEFFSKSEAENSEQIRNRVEAARQIQIARNRHFKFEEGFNNAGLNQSSLRQVVILDKPAKQLMSMAIETLRLSGRGYSRILKVSRTIADLKQQEKVTKTELEEALSYRLIN